MVKFSPGSTIMREIIRRGTNPCTHPPSKASWNFCVLELLRKLTEPARARELSDVELLERFRHRREEAAFTLLVQRHGPMVLAICRRILGNVHEAEDAFQATFLVLVRNAGTIRKQQSLAAWLHGVAARIAHKARMRCVRQQVRQREILSPIIMDDPSKTLATAELRAVLDEEIERLPAKYRAPLVLCYLADKTHEQAAHELSWPKSSVTARLARARELLQRRLQQRGPNSSVDARGQGLAAAARSTQAIRTSQRRGRKQRKNWNIESKPESLGAVRGVEVLEWISTAGATRLLDELANGGADARLTSEAGEAKRRLSRWARATRSTWTSGTIRRNTETRSSARLAAPARAARQAFPGWDIGHMSQPAGGQRSRLRQSGLLASSVAGKKHEFP